MKYLITGGCGFLGSNIASALLAEKQDVYIIDNLFIYIDFCFDFILLAVMLAGTICRWVSSIIIK